MERPELTADHLSIESAKTVASARKIHKAATEIYSLIEELEVDLFLGEDEMWTRLEALSNLIREKLKAAGWRLDR